MQRLFKIALPALVCAAAIFASASSAQTAPTAQSARAPQDHALEIAFTYTTTESQLINDSHFWMQGGTAQIHGQFYKGWGALADISGAHIGNIQSSGVGLDLITATFGPRYTWKPATGRYSVYGQALGGEAWGSNSTFPGRDGVKTRANSVTVKAGGGLNLNLSSHLALRIVEADYLRIQLPNSTNNAQNNLQLGAGVVFRLP